MCFCLVAREKLLDIKTVISCYPVFIAIKDIKRNRVSYKEWNNPCKKEGRIEVYS